MEKKMVEQDPNAQGASDGAEARAELEEQAKKYGWRPLEEFDRDPDGWVDADRFMELGSTQNKMLRDTKRELEAELQKVREESAGEIAGMKRVFSEAQRRAVEKAQSDYDARIQQLEAQRREAATEADTDKYDQVTAEIAKAQDARPAEVPPDPAPAPDPYVTQYMQEHEWTSNPLLRQEAYAAVEFGIHAGKVQREDLKGHIAYAEEVLGQKYPHMFQKEQQQTRVDPGGLGGGAPVSNFGADKLPADARSVGLEFVQQGIFKNLDEYAQAYFEDA